MFAQILPFCTFRCPIKFLYFFFLLVLNEIYLYFLKSYSTPFTNYSYFFLFYIYLKRMTNSLINGQNGGINEFYRIIERKYLCTVRSSNKEPLVYWMAIVDFILQVDGS